MPEQQYNGELRKLYNDLKREFDVLGATYDERWTSHEKRSDRLNQKFDMIHIDIECIKTLINEKFSNLNCNVHTERMSNHGIAIKVLYGLIILVLGIVVKIHIG